MQLSRILVPTDFSASAVQASHVALALAKPLGGEILLLNVYLPPTVMMPGGSTFVPTPSRLVDFSQEAEAELAAAQRALAERAEGVPIRAEAAMGGDAAEILRYAESGRFDLIVMGTHGRRGLSRLVIGSVAESVTRRSPIPVLTVRSGEEAP